MTPPSISVVVTCYNYEAYVGEAIESVLSQGYAQTDLIVVNDGSRDGSLDVIETYRERCRIIDQPNQGHIGACNTGAAAAKGDLVIFLDADDRLEPGALAAIAAAWSPDVAKVQYDLKIIDGAGADLGRRFCNFSGQYSPEEVADSFRRSGTYRWPVTAGNAYSSWFIEKLFPLTATMAPDGYLNTIAPVYGKVKTIPRPLAAYRLHGANQWSSNGADPSRLPQRIHQRQHEVAVMRQHAERMAVAVPSGNVLDSELPFLNYRLLARKLALPYEGDATDSALRLLLGAVRVLKHERLPLKLTLAHLTWFGVLALSPSQLARPLIELRFNRTAVIESARGRVRRFRRRLQRAA